MGKRDYLIIMKEGKTFTPKDVIFRSEDVGGTKIYEASLSKVIVNTEVAILVSKHIREVARIRTSDILKIIRDDLLIYPISKHNVLDLEKENEMLKTIIKSKDLEILRLNKKYKDLEVDTLLN